MQLYYEDENNVVYIDNLWINALMVIGQAPDPIFIDKNIFCSLLEKGADIKNDKRYFNKSHS